MTDISKNRIVNLRTIEVSWMDPSDQGFGMGRFKWRAHIYSLNFQGR